ncbi:glycosyl transferase [Prochlorococcus marinus str. MU1412]|nr:glycosyl transferase [Prochlorococcus marinus str. MU1412]
MIINYFFILILINYYFTYFLVNASNNFFLDKPNSRSMHQKPTITGGGISFVLSTAFFSLFVDNLLFIICLPLALVGLLDDFFSLKNIYRYIVQILTSIFIILQSKFVLNYFENFNQFLFLIGIICLSVLITAIINFINFMDGIDGLITSCLIILFGFAAIKVDLSFLIIIGGLIGFLCWNWHPSKIFMGDTGSTFVGAVFAGAVFNTDNFGTSFDLLFCASPLFFDAIICILRRYLAGENIFKPHSLHLYQRLCKAGWSHSKVSINYLISILLLIISCLLNIVFLKILCFFLIYSYAFFLEVEFASPFELELLKSKSK